MLLAPTPTTRYPARLGSQYRGRVRREASESPRGSWFENEAFENVDLAGNRFSTQSKGRRLGVRKLIRFWSSKERSSTAKGALIWSGDGWKLNRN